MTELERISAIRTAATWMRRTSRQLDAYPKLSQLDVRMRTEVQQFACGILPWPARWTVSIYRLAVNG